MKDTTFNELKSLVSKTPRYEIEDMDFTDEEPIKAEQKICWLLFS